MRPMAGWSVITFYKFVTLSELPALQARLLDHCATHGIKGTILLATEGINGTLAGSPEAIEVTIEYLRSVSQFADLEFKRSQTEVMPFQRLKVRIKPEIVTLGRPEADPSQRVGIYVEPQDWNALILDPEVLVIDTRNQYEVTIGSFQGAVNPGTDSFRQFPEYVQQHLDPNQHKKIAMFCTGGIRCEKASAFLLTQGFQEVYHLKGGILKYLETVPAESSLWQGECFVFDERVAVQQGLEPGTYEMCLSCGRPISEADKASPAYEAGISCPYCVENLTPEKRRRQLARQQLRETQR
ncbi:MAG: rhodanese-related sulfurtransferase [Synechococcales cyanobacterium C42_A2020_086]|nr:rhodanese-related sulfurtransferase [Synechococcales cyanobacterium C42_A2020_086]